MCGGEDAKAHGSGRSWLLALLAAAAVLIAPKASRAGPPLITDDPYTPGRNRWEVNLSYGLSLTKESFELEPTRRQELLADLTANVFQRLGLPEWIQPGARARRVHRRVYEQEAPLIDLNYGVTDWDQIKVEFPVLLTDGPDDDHEDGFGSMTLGYKYRFLDEERFPVSVSVYPQVELPTSARRLGQNRKPLYVLPLQAGRHFMGEKLFVYGNVGFEAAPGKDQDDSWFYGLATEWEVEKGFVLAAEVAGSEPTQGEGASDLVFNLGFKWNISDSVTLMTAMGRSFYAADSDRPEFLGFWGIQLRF